MVLAALLFFFIPYSSLTPKTNLVIYFLVSFGLIVFWRLVLAQMVGARTIKNALFIAEGSEVDELIEEINNNTERYGFVVKHTFAPRDVLQSPALQEQVLDFVDHHDISVVVADTHDENMQTLLPIIYNLTYLHVRFSFIDFGKMYEQVFYRVPLSALRYNWFLQYISTGPRVMYDTMKRIFDFLIGIVVCIVCLIAIPFVWIAIVLEDRGSLFISQKRTGKNNDPIKIVKFRTMTGSDEGDEVLNSKLEVTKVGAFLRASRLDELPQGLNLIKGDISFIGPRPELPALAAEYDEAIPYYNARHSIKPGLTGWAQIYHQEHPHHGRAVEETRNKLSYDLFYVKHRSLLLDLMISLKTIKTLMMRVGR